METEAGFFFFGFLVLYANFKISKDAMINDMQKKGGLFALITQRCFVLHKKIGLKIN